MPITKVMYMIGEKKEFLNRDTHNIKHNELLAEHTKKQY